MSLPIIFRPFRYKRLNQYSSATDPQTGLYAPLHTNHLPRPLPDIQAAPAQCPSLQSSEEEEEEEGDEAAEVEEEEEEGEGRE